MDSKMSVIADIRQFSRFYTRLLGLLDSHVLSSDFSLSEARVLFEIGNTERCTAKMLTEQLGIDAGYLSRIMKRFEKAGLAYKVQSEEDGRSYLLHLSELGKKTLADMNELSNEQIRGMIGDLSQQQLIELSRSMSTIARTLSSESTQPQVNLRTDLKPGDIGTLIHLHGWIYAQECGYNSVFEAYVCRTFYKWMEKRDPERDRIWLAEAEGQIVGSIAIIGKPEERVQLRWFILHPDYRGSGLGKNMLEQAIEYCREKGFKKVLLETTSDQEKAIRMYSKIGFRKVAEQTNEVWGTSHIEETYELEL